MVTKFLCRKACNYHRLQPMESTFQLFQEKVHQTKRKSQLHDTYLLTSMILKISKHKNPFLSLFPFLFKLSEIYDGDLSCIPHKWKLRCPHPEPKLGSLLTVFIQFGKILVLLENDHPTNYITKEGKILTTAKIKNKIEDQYDTISY